LFAASNAEKTTEPKLGFGQTPARFCSSLVKMISTKPSRSRFVVLISSGSTLVGERASPAMAPCRLRSAVGVPGLPMGSLKLPPPLWKCSPAICPPKQCGIRDWNGAGRCIDVRG
jgi:hypothetical protein